MWGLFYKLGNETLICVSSNKEKLEQKRSDLEKLGELAISFNNDQNKQMEVLYKEYSELRTQAHTLNEINQLHKKYKDKWAKFEKRDKNYIYEHVFVREVEEI
jgi:hypothetical protein